MRILYLFLFFGIIYGNEDKVYTNQQLTELVDQLMANQKKMDGKIVANEADISGNKANIIANSDDLQVLTYLFPFKTKQNVSFSRLCIRPSIIL